MGAKKQTRLEPSLKSVRRELFLDSEGTSTTDSVSDSDSEPETEPKKSRKATTPPFLISSSVQKQAHVPNMSHTEMHNDNTTGTDVGTVIDDDTVQPSLGLCGILAILFLFLCLTFISATFVYPEQFEFKTLEVHRADGELYIHWQNNKKIYVLGLVSGAVISALLGFTCCCFSWIVTYFDSLDPGHIPPTPLSPAKYRHKSGHTFHMAYVVTIVNGLAVFLYSLWNMKDSFLFI